MKEFSVSEDTLERTDIPCFRCGVCCTKYSPTVTITEAENIAAALQISLDRFLDRYVDDSWFEPGRFLLDTQDGACIFLENSSDSRTTSCRIHPVRPQSCREWQPGLERKECLEGLQKYWGLTVDTLGRLQGPEEKAQEFRSALESGKFL